MKTITISTMPGALIDGRSDRDSMFGSVVDRGTSRPASALEAAVIGLTGSDAVRGDVRSADLGTPHHTRARAWRACEAYAATEPTVGSTNADLADPAINGQMWNRTPKFGPFGHSHRWRSAT